VEENLLFYKSIQIWYHASFVKKQLKTVNTKIYRMKANADSKVQVSKSYISMLQTSSTFIPSHSFSNEIPPDIQKHLNML